MVDKLIAWGVIAYLAFFGLLFVSQALQMADIIPHFMLRPDFIVDTHKTVSMLLFGEGCLLGAFFVGRIFFKYLK